MSDDRNHTGSPDRDRTSLGEDHEIRDWTTSVSESEPCEAVDAVGNSAGKVREYLKVG